KIDRRVWILLLSHVSQIAHDADDVHWLLEQDLFAKRIFGAERAPRIRLGNHDHRPLARAVRLGDRPPAKQGNAQDAEKRRVDVAPTHELPLLIAGSADV